MLDASDDQVATLQVGGLELLVQRNRKSDEYPRQQNQFNGQRGRELPKGPFSARRNE
jgi:hypothetical protein